MCHWQQTYMSLCAHYMQAAKADHLLLLLVCHCFEVCLQPLDATQYCENQGCSKASRPHTAGGAAGEHRAITTEDATVSE